MAFDVFIFRVTVATQPPDNNVFNLPTEKKYRKIFRLIFINQWTRRDMKAANHTQQLLFQLQSLIGSRLVAENKKKRLLISKNEVAIQSRCSTSKRILNASQWVCLFYVYSSFAVCVSLKPLIFKSRHTNWK